MKNHLDLFLDTLTAEDFMKAYPGSLEFVITKDEFGLEVGKYLQKHCSGLMLYIGGITRFEDRMQEYVKGKEHILKKLAMDMHISEKSLQRIAKQNIKSGSQSIF